jgi:hypothetical protein
MSKNYRVQGEDFDNFAAALGYARENNVAQIDYANDGVAVWSLKRTADPKIWRQFIGSTETPQASFTLEADGLRRIQG